MIIEAGNALERCVSTYMNVIGSLHVYEGVCNDLDGR